MLIALDHRARKLCATTSMIESLLAGTRRLAPGGSVVDEFGYGR
jgi:hypothetical protein